MPSPTFLTQPYLLASPNYTLSAIAAGANRRVGVIIALANGSSSVDVVAPSSVTIGGVSAVRVAGNTGILEAKNLTLWEIKESDISSMVGTNVVISGSTLASIFTLAGYVLQDVHQSSVGAWAQNFKVYGYGNTPLSLAREASSFTIAIGMSADEFNLANPAKLLTITNSGKLNIGWQADSAVTNNSTYSSATSDVLFLAVNYKSVPEFLISGVNGDNTLNAGAVNTASVTGYAVGVNPVVSGTVGSLALTSVSQATTIATFTIPAPVNDSYYPQPDTSHTLTLTDGSNPATFNAVMNSLAGYTSIVAVSPDLADPHKIPYWLTSTAVDDDRIMYKTADMTVSADGGISGATLGVTTIYYHWRVADSKIYAYEALLSEDGIATSTGLTVRGLTVSGLGVSGLTVRGL